MYKSCSGLKSRSCWPSSWSRSSPPCWPCRSPGSAPRSSTSRKSTWNRTGTFWRAQWTPSSKPWRPPGQVPILMTRTPGSSLTWETRAGPPASAETPSSAAVSTDRPSSRGTVCGPPGVPLRWSRPAGTRRGAGQWLLWWYLYLVCALNWKKCVDMWYFLMYYSCFVWRQM